jgi:hypothetical protein
MTVLSCYMLPESGKRTDFKDAVFDAYTSPMLGEVYAWMDGEKYRECWKVVGFSEPGLRRIHIDVYHARHDGLRVRGTCGSKVHPLDWAKCILTGDVRYVGMDVPNFAYDC